MNHEIERNKPRNNSRRGKVVRVRGSVVDIRFNHGMPDIKNALRTGDNGDVIIEVANHLDEVTVRGIALTPTEGLARGTEVIDTGKHLHVPVGHQMLGRAFNVFGQSIDGGDQIEGVQWRSIHQQPVALTRQTTNMEAFRTGIKLIDVRNPDAHAVVRQIAFYDFECKLHAARRQGELTPEDINALWMSVQGESLGPVFNFMDGYETFWVYIPHFVHSPFYVYAYAFGDGLVNALYAVYRESPEGFQDKYFEMLKAGGSKHHKELLAPFGLDASDPAFWDKGLSMISDMIDELEAMEG